MSYSDFKVPSVFAQNHLYFSDGIGIQNQAEYRINRKSFRNNVLIYVVKGSFYVEQNGLHLLTRGDAIVMRLSEKHHYYTSSQDVATILWMHFGCAKEDKLLQYVQEEAGLPYIDKNLRIKESLVTCLRASQGKDDNREYIYSDMIYKSLLSCCKKINEDKRIGDTSATSIFKRSVSEYIQEKVQVKVSLEDFAETCGFSKYHFIKLFKKNYNCTPVQYIYKMKVEYSKNQLCYTSDTINQISDELGFESQGHFTKVFKRYTGVTPSTFRRSL